MFVNYNDYELLYLIGDGSNKALDMMYNKYSVFISKTVTSFYPYGDKKNDLMQEGLMLLDKCIKNFNPALDVTFYTYFKIVLFRRLGLVRSDDYYFKKTITLYDNVVDRHSGFGKNSWLFSTSLLWKDELEALIYQECIIEDLSIVSFAKKYKLTYHTVYCIKKAMLEKLKSVLTKL